MASSLLNVLHSATAPRERDLSLKTDEPLVLILLPIVMHKILHIWLQQIGWLYTGEIWIHRRSSVSSENQMYGQVLVCLCHLNVHTIYSDRGL